MDTYEKKLALAKEALDSGSYDKETIEYIFPELKESEDEKISREITEFLVDFNNGEYERPNENTIDSWLSWLEKQQGEQNLDDKAEPKFKVGDWVIVGDKTLCQIEEVAELPYNHYQYWTTDEHWFGDGTESRLWTIQDAKDGDVLKEDSCTFIIERMKPDGTAIVHCCLFDDNDFDLMGSTLSFDVDSTYPATKEQRDTLMKAMTDAGYTFDFEKKELKKIEQKPVENVNGAAYGIDGLWHAITILEETLGKVEGYQSDDGILEHKCAITAVRDLAKKQREQKPVWSEDDEEMFDAVIVDIQFTQKAHNHEVNQVVYEREIDWLKSLKERMKGE